MNTSFRIQKTIIALSACAIAAFATAKADSNWNGSTSTDWNDNANWSSGLPNGGGVWAAIFTGTSNVPVISADSTGSPVAIGIGGDSRLDQTAGMLTGTASDWPGGSMLIGMYGSGGTYNLANTGTTGGTFTGYGTGSGSYITGANGSIQVGAGWWWDHSTAVVNVNTSGTLQVNGHLAIAGNNGDNCAVNIDAGTVIIKGGWQTSSEIACGSGTTAVIGSLNMSGGTVSLDHRLVIGAGNRSGDGSGGNPYVYASGSNVGTVTMTGGTLTTGLVAAAGETWHDGVDLASGYGGGTGGTATFNLNGGTLVTSNIFSTAESGTDPIIYTSTSGSSTFNFNGGTLQPKTGNPSFVNLMSGLTRANVRNGGAVIDTNGVDSYFTQKLEHSDISGDNAIDGGLTKNGAGKLEIQVANNFTGPVVVNSGTLSVTTADYFGGAFRNSSGITVNSGATLAATKNSLCSIYNTYNGAAPITVNAGGKAYAAGGQQYAGLVTLNGGELASSGTIGSDGSWTFGYFGSAKKLAVTDDSTVSADKVVFNNGANIDVTTGKTLTFNGTIADSGTNATSLIVGGGSGTVLLNSTNTYTGATTVNAGKLVFGLSQALSGGLTVTGGTAALSSHTGGAGNVRAIDTSALTVSGGGVLDLNNNALVVRNGDVAAIAAAIMTGANGGVWNGPGLSSSTAGADANHITTLGISTAAAQGLTGGSFAGVAGLSGSDVLVKYTYYGDANFSGTVTGADYGAIDTGFGAHLTGWENGDFNLDGVVTGADYGAIDTAFGLQGGTVLAQGGGAGSQAAAVPEPATNALLLFGAAGMLAMTWQRSRRRGV